MSTTATPVHDGWQIRTKYGAYRISATHPLTDIDDILTRLVKGHPDTDALLDVRLKIAKEAQP